MLRWIRLPQLPLNLYTPFVIKGLGDTISKYIDIDEKTATRTNPAYARLCLELDLLKPLPLKVWIGTILNKGFWQNIVIEGRTDYCPKCGLHGHTIAICRKN